MYTVYYRWFVVIYFSGISAFDTEDRRGKVTNSTHHDDCDNVKPQINPWAMMVLLGYISLGTTLAIGNVVRQRITGISTCIVCKHFFFFFHR